MIQIRSCVFETNSSSTHSLAIPFSCNAPRYVSCNIEYFGWNFEEVDAADYFYTAIYAVSNTIQEAERRVKRFKEILEAHNIEYHLGEVRYSQENDEDGDWLCLDDAGIDHGDELTGLVNDLLEDGERLLRFLGGGLVFTGNDNDNDDGFLSRENEVVEEYSFKTNQTTTYPNPYYMPDHADYEWHYKSN